jgi:hypothetical protein
MLISAREQQGISYNELNVLSYTSYVVGSLNAIGCSFILCKTFLKWKLCKRNGKKLTMSYRLPFYTAIAGTKEKIEPDLKNSWK